MSRSNASFVALVVLGLSSAACSLVADFDHNKIPKKGTDGGPEDGAITRDGSGPIACGEMDGGECNATCDNEILEPGETCDPSSTCPESCDDGTACTTMAAIGSAAECNLACEQREITRCENDDGCCPADCNFSRDIDCTTTCGNGMVEPGETCDPTTLCATDCGDGNACTLDTTTGSLANCNVACSYQPITGCTSDDGCCPAGCNANNDEDCTTSCDNGAVEPGETCDPASSCPTTCDDGNACTINTLTGSAANCNVACGSQVITQCQSGDGCCPAGCNNNNDRDCTTTCNNEVIEPGETCDPSASCPTTCNDGTACTIDSITGSAANCTFACRHQQVTQCQNGDGCCPAGCNANNDRDCTTTCNNRVVEPGETCDPPGSCPTLASCNDGSACTIDTLTGSAANCTAACGRQTITQCRSGDGCCPPGCNNNSDRDCTATCNNNVIEAGETCDPSRSCLTSCNDGNACTLDTLAGSPTNCTSTCSHQTITQCQNSDGCCPPGCNSNNDRECSARCGNGVVESGETCDLPASCPTSASCNDGNACTVDTLTGSAANCNAACGHQTITQCRNGDGCCPPGCNANTDRDCTATCGNNALEPGETCDPPGTPCATSATCNDGNSCTLDTLTGSAANCTASCGHQTITQCQSNDSCCPPGCNIGNDNNCSASCGDGVVTNPETCDPQSTCPTSCNDGNACTIDGLTGSATNCNVACSRQTISQCQSGDGCCPPGCNANNDNNCTATCGNSVLETGETCDPPGSCPTTATCTDGNACTLDTLTGSAANCNAACSHQTITQCQSMDGCCPPGCNANNDNDCTATCNNGVLEAGETCEPRAMCPVACNDQNACTIDSLTGSAANCNSACSFQMISQCANGDACCPPGCTIANDNACSAACGDGVVTTPPETCDPPSTCATTCADMNACTIDNLTGSAANCNVECSHQAITQCQSADGCCPSGCTIGNDTDCAARCGDAVVTAPETCDPCPATCADMNACTTDSQTGGSAATCSLVCANQPVTACVSGDGCCPTGCSNAGDAGTLDSDCTM
jgi:hypothetical protein